MIEVSGVVTNLVHIRSDHFSEAIILLQIDRQVAFDLPPNLHQRFSFFLIINRDADNIRTSRYQIINLTNGRVDVRGLGRGHALNRNRSIATNEAISDSNAASWVADNRELCVVGHDIVCVERSIVSRHLRGDSLFFLVLPAGQDLAACRDLHTLEQSKCGGIVDDMHLRFA